MVECEAFDLEMGVRFSLFLLWWCSLVAKAAGCQSEDREFESPHHRDIKDMKGELENE